MTYRLNKQELAEAVVAFLQTKHKFLDGSHFTVDYEVQSNEIYADVKVRGPGAAQGPYR